jgi:D-aminopeptidase
MMIKTWVYGANFFRLGIAHNPSGDIFLAFSTASEIPVQTVGSAHRDVDPWKPSAMSIEMIDDQTINALFEAVAESVEESIYNALFMAKTMTGRAGQTIAALDLVKVKELMEKYA